MSPSILNPTAVTGIGYPALTHGGQWFKCVDKKMTAPEWGISEGDYICVALHGNISDNERALELAKVQYRVGKTDLRSVEQRQLALLSARTALLRVQTDRLAQRANLYLALGGGFSDAAGSPLASR